MKKKLWFIAVVCGLLNACATVNPMAVNKATTTVDTASKSIVLMTVDVSRSDDSRYVPVPYVVKVERAGAQTKSDRHNFTFGKDVATFEADGHPVYMVSMALAPGEYVLGEVTGNASAFPFIGTFNVPLVIPFTVKPNAVAYVGHLTAKLRPRKEGEFRAGPLLPLIDQGVTGLSGGTWDVSIDDGYTHESPRFRTAYKALSNTTIENSPLPPFDRAAVQRWWEGTTSDDKKTVTASEPKTPKAD